MPRQARLDAPRTLHHLIAFIKPACADGRQGVVAHPSPQPAEGVPVAALSAMGRRCVITQPSVPDPIGPRTWRRPWLRGRLRSARRRSRAPMFPLDSRRRCARYSTLTLAGDQGGLRLAARGRAGPVGAAPAGSLPGRRSDGARARKGNSYHLTSVGQRSQLMRLKLC
jgi:hypothetical protein